MVEQTRTTEDRARAGREFLERHRNGLSIESVLHSGNLDRDEAEQAFRTGTGSLTGLPEPRVLFYICQAIGADYIQCMFAFGHLIKKGDRS